MKVGPTSRSTTLRAPAAGDKEETWAEREIYLYGAHATRYKRKGMEDLLWMSPTSPFVAELTVTVGKELELSLLVENRDGEPFRYEDCFHTYFRVDRAFSCAVEGLDGVGYIDRGRSDVRAVQAGVLRPSGETVNAYMGSPSACALVDPLLKRRIAIAQAGCSSTVVWNPGEAAAAKNAEISTAWNEFLCIESANCLDTPVLLLPGTAHRSAVRFTVEEET